MPAKIVANVSVGACVPAFVGTVAQLTAELKGKLQGLLSISAALAIKPPALAAQVQGAITLVGQLEAMVSAGLDVAPPGVTLNIAATASLIAGLTAQLAALLAIPLGTAGIAVIAYDGDAQKFGADMQAKINTFAPPGNNVQAVTYLCTEPAAFEALAKVLLTG